MSNQGGVLGNSIDIHVGRNDNSAEIRADVKVEEFCSKRIWGQVINCYNQPVANSLVKLVRVVCQGNKKFYEGVAHTITDCEGFYQFDVCDNDDNECYKLIINKAVTGQELVIDTQGGNCNACNDNGPAYNPCPPYNPIIKDYNPNECNCNQEPCNRPQSGYQNNCGCNDNYNQNDYGCNNNQNDCGCNNNQNDCSYDHKGKPKTNYATYTR